MGSIWQHARKIDGRMLAAAISALYAVSLFSPVASTKPYDRSLDGWDVLSIGWFGLIDWQFGWYANPVLWLVVIALAFRAHVGKAASIFLAFCGVSALWWTDFLMDEGGGRATIVEFHRGYYLWMLAVALGAAAPFISQRPVEQE